LWEDVLQEHEGAFLFELRGQSPGVAQGLTRDVFRIGSDLENDLIMKDPGVALYQAEIVFQDRRFVIKNFSLEGSVFLNGEPFEEATLQKGDILTLGDSMYRFVTQGEALTLEELWRPVGGRHGLQAGRFKPLPRATFLVVLSVLAIGAVIWIVMSQNKKPGPIPSDTEDRLATTAGVVDPKGLREMYDRGVDLLAARRWDQAVMAFETVRENSPNYKEVDRLYEQAITESRASENLNQGKGRLTEGDPSGAKRELEKIPEMSVFYREADNMIRELDEKILSAKLDEARKQVEGKDLEAARMAVKAILERNPGSEEAAILLKQIGIMEGNPHKEWSPAQRARSGATPPVPASESAQNVETARARGPGGAQVDSAARTSPNVAVRKDVLRGPPGIQRARSGYLRGDTEQSLDDLEYLLERKSSGETLKNAREMQSRLLAARNYFQQAETLQKEGRYLEALEMWEKFLAKDREVAGTEESADFRKASISLSQIYCRRGREAFDAGQLVQASRLWQMAGRIDPGSVDARSGIREIRKSAQDYYREGYSLQEINPTEALRKWKVVLQIVPPDDPYYQKAKREIQRFKTIP
jgi:hypothetical protein